MGYFWLDTKFMVEGEARNGSRGIPADTLEDAIQRVRIDITDKHPNAANIDIQESAKNRGNPLLIDELVKRVKEDRPDLSDTHLRECEFMLLVHTGRKDYTMGGFWKPLGPEAKAIIEDGNYKDFVYIRRWGIVVFDVSKHTSHEMFMANWNWILSNLLDNPSLTLDNMPCMTDEGAEADKFLHNCHGIFLSSIGQRPLKSSNMTLTAQERQVFSSMKMIEIEP
jgi:hypothetical protein